MKKTIFGALALMLGLAPALAMAQPMPPGYYHYGPRYERRGWRRPPPPPPMWRRPPPVWGRYYGPPPPPPPPPVYPYW
ncbi:hypothetical protein IFJ82_02605 [Novacetimonas hansenii]|uniref:Uncharacterized protein n=2 Tax=Novacetimonas hansenii TaxID=436 RepID=A0AAW5EWD1_NOVHA|nr:hypothetical protein [Novacetimonas hansenii]EFG83201.1 hypothetical protein GXY_14537 [Novacetimonas hansenii ATCC 23769]MBL7236216.1 hypothetical protein [Novacetimonas hansenii]MCJ8355091.1 hypothetical protein [Novacetimonas hansenii]PYD71587.1 hypothetical protein CFR74_13890 [Novacetimonas hansenii]QOF95587.1 hypothetical protein IFJ82_02605 [Novacetimonas hansenii]